MRSVCLYVVVKNYSSWLTFQCGILQGLLNERTRTMNATRNEISVIDELFNGQECAFTRWSKTVYVSAPNAGPNAYDVLWGYMTRGWSPQITSRMIPPKVAVMRPETTHSVGANPLFAAACTPTTQKAANPNASREEPWKKGENDNVVHSTNGRIVSQIDDASHQVIRQLYF